MQDDEIILHEGTSTVYGGYGNDVLRSEPKLDADSAAILTGGAGTDKFFIGRSLKGSGETFIKDFSPGEVIYTINGGGAPGIPGCEYSNRITYEQVFEELGEFGEIGVFIAGPLDFDPGSTTICEGIICHTFPMQCVKEGSAGATTTGTAGDDWIT